MSEIIFVIIVKYLSGLKRIMLVCCISLIGLQLGELYALPCSTDIAMVSQMFLLVGFYMRKTEVKVEKTSCRSIMALLLAFLIVANINSSINMDLRKYGNYMLFYIGGITGTFLVISLAVYITKLKKCVRDGLVYCGQQSVFILIGHYIVKTFYTKVYIMLKPNIVAETVRLNVDYAVEATLLGILIPVIVCKYLGNYPILREFKN